MKPFDTIKDYGKFLKEQEEQKLRMRLGVMLSLLDSITETMSSFGWVRKGKGTVTDGMTKSGIFKFDYNKVFGTELVTVTISININDDYVDSHGISSGSNRIKIKGSKPIQSTRWWKGGIETSIELNPNSTYYDKKVDTFHLTTHLKTINETYS